MPLLGHEHPDAHLVDDSDNVLGLLYPVAYFPASLDSFEQAASSLHDGILRLDVEQPVVLGWLACRSVDCCGISSACVRQPAKEPHR